MHPISSDFKKLFSMTSLFIFSIFSLFCSKRRFKIEKEVPKPWFLHQNLVTFLTDCCATLQVFEPVFLHSFVLRLFPGRMNVGNK